MKSILVIAMMALASMLAGCGGGGSSASTPTGVTVDPGDTSATINWNNDASVQYWVWVAQSPNVSTSDCATLTGCRIFTDVRPPFIVTGLVNGKTYSVTVNGRHNDGPGGSGSPTIAFVPRLAGATWTVGTPLTGSNLLGVGYSSSLSTGLAGLATVGAAGTIFTTGNVTAWVAATSGTTANLNAVQHRDNLFVAIGDGGTVVTSPDSVTWTPRSTPTTNALYALDGSGTGQVVAVGAQGTILVTSNSTDWTAHDSKTTANLYGVGFGDGRYVAVGANGTVATSSDGTTWTLQKPPTSVDLRGVFFGSRSATSNVTAIATFVAVGRGGTILTSPDGITWTARESGVTADLESVTFGTQFVAVGQGGTIVTSSDAGVTWVRADSGTTANLNSVSFTLLSPKVIGVGYVAVGDGGTNLTAF
ncbi:MAG TPA: hypothetical protein VF925_02750 [Casimicrobiaceae bacterium]